MYIDVSLHGNLNNIYICKSMSLKEDLEHVSESIGYLYAPGGHHTTTRFISAARLFSENHKNRLSHGKPVLKSKVNELQKTKNIILKNHVPYVSRRDMNLQDVRITHNLPYISRRDLKLQDTFMHSEFMKVQSTIIWNFRAILDRIGELDRPGSFMEIYIKNGPICSSKPDEPKRGAPREYQERYSREKKRWMEDNRKGYKALRNLQSHVHQIYFASSQMDVLFEIYRKYLNMYGDNQTTLDAICRISKWIHTRYSILEQRIKLAMKCKGSENNDFHIFLQGWRNNSSYKYLKSFLLKKYIGFYNKSIQSKYLAHINMTNKHL
jgi:hypothetical protein